jgi:hypothetical protein
MKRLPLIVVLTASIFATACSSFRLGEAGAAPEAQAAPAPKEARNAEMAENSLTIQDEKGTVVIQKVQFQSGISSATVERLGKRFGCNALSGAGLITPQGPVEVYRMQCDNGTTFVAQCELRQCRPMR